jgi:putative protease
MTGKLELVCPAGTLPALRAAVDAGADAVYVGLRDRTNARNFPGLNFGRDELAEGLSYAHARGRKLFLAVNTYPAAGSFGPWRAAVDTAARIGVDAVILADIGLLAYCAETHPDLRRHLSVQASAANSEAIAFYAREFGVRRVVLPRVLSVPEIATLNSQVSVDTEVFAFGGMCVMAEGRCSLSGCVTGLSPNLDGVCSPASHVRYVERGDELVAQLGGFTIDTFRRGEPAGYPTLCKGRFVARGRPSHLFEDPTSLNAIALLPDLMAAGVRALKIEGRQRGRAYVQQVTAVFRRAIDAASSNAAVDASGLADIAEGGRMTGGAYTKTWR